MQDSFEIDKKEFGNFILELRKEKGLTQKDLAERLFVSDKAVSKWECGLSMPDITLLKPLANNLGVTVTELLEGRYIEQSEHMNTEKIDAIIHKAVLFSEEEMLEQRERRRKNGLSFIICVVLGCLEILGLWALGITFEQMALQSVFVLMLLGFVFGIWFCFFAKEKLPTYYDENKISYYSDGFFQLNMVGIRFNNSNWKHILQAGRIWTMIAMTVPPVVCLILNCLFDERKLLIAASVCMVCVAIGGLFIPIYVVAKKYE